MKLLRVFIYGTLTLAHMRIQTYRKQVVTSPSHSRNCWALTSLAATSSYSLLLIKIKIAGTSYYSSCISLGVLDIFVLCLLRNVTTAKSSPRSLGFLSRVLPSMGPFNQLLFKSMQNWSCNSPRANPRHGQSGEIVSYCLSMKYISGCGLDLGNHESLMGPQRVRICNSQT